MDAGFWHRRWEQKDIGFHESDVNGLLVDHFKDLPIQEKANVFVPLCGKTLSIAWLMAKGYSVVGVELNQTAIEELFEELDVIPEIEEKGGLKIYNAPSLTVFVGDFFALSNDLIGPVDAVFDRAALVALPQTMRADYTQHLMEITNKAPQLLIVYEYDESLMKGPPFPIPEKEVKSHYQDRYQVSLLNRYEMPDGLKDKKPVKEIAWLLT